MPHIATPACCRSMRGMLQFDDRAIRAVLSPNRHVIANRR
ncbi:MAG: hypothetical protein OJF55_000830 [Rhodanobacteraceae bacterium]|nr:MAG: hypothetical protein OJF55_000830 [Rhodanobacteraceae bacterium]